MQHFLPEETIFTPLLPILPESKTEDSETSSTMTKLKILEVISEESLILHFSNICSIGMAKNFCLDVRWHNSNALSNNMPRFPTLESDTFPACHNLDFWGTGHYEGVMWQHEAGHAYMHGMQVGWTWLQLHGAGELHLPCYIVSVISETDMERIYDDQT